MGECALLVLSPQNDQGVIGNFYEVDRLNGSECVLAFTPLLPWSLLIIAFRLWEHMGSWQTLPHV